MDLIFLMIFGVVLLVDRFRCSMWDDESKYYREKAERARKELEPPHGMLQETADQLSDPSYKNEAMMSLKPYLVNIYGEDAFNEKFNAYNFDKCQISDYDIATFILAKQGYLSSIPRHAYGLGGPNNSESFIRYYKTIEEFLNESGRNVKLYLKLSTGYSCEHRSMEYPGYLRMLDKFVLEGEKDRFNTYVRLW